MGMHGEHILDQWLKLYNEREPIRVDGVTAKHLCKRFSREDVGGVSGALTKTDDEDLSVDCQSKR